MEGAILLCDEQEEERRRQGEKKGRGEDTTNMAKMQYKL
jgi:hypothetical protein